MSLPSCHLPNDPEDVVSSISLYADSILYDLVSALLSTVLFGMPRISSQHGVWLMKLPPSSFFFLSEGISTSLALTSTYILISAGYTAFLSGFVRVCETDSWQRLQQAPLSGVSVAAVRNSGPLHVYNDILGSITQGYLTGHTLRVEALHVPNSRFYCRLEFSDIEFGMFADCIIDYQCTSSSSSACPL